MAFGVNFGMHPQATARYSGDTFQLDAGDRDAEVPLTRSSAERDIMEAAEKTLLEITLKAIP
jgi:hypothetical protein